MTRQIRSRRAGLVRDPARMRPLYARLLRLRHLKPSGFLCFVFLEGAVALGILLALAELVSWWGVLALPLTVALMVKLNDVVAGALSPPSRTIARVATGVRPARAAGAGLARGRVVATPPGRPARPDGPTRRLIPPPLAPGIEGPTRRLFDDGSGSPLEATFRADDGARADGAGGVDPAGAVNGHPVAWKEPAEQLDSPQRLSRQSASRRYE